MMKSSNRQAICDVLMAHAANDRDIVVLCSDSRGSASLSAFADAFPDQFVEVGIAEQSLVSVAAGLAKCGKKVFAASPACFLTTRSYEQCKIDVCYSNTNVKLIGISGGVSYGALGMSHHSTQDIAAMGALPNMRVYLPADYWQTGKLIENLLKDDAPAYIRVGRNPVESIYSDESVPFVLNKAVNLSSGSDVTIIACGETVSPAIHAAEKLNKKGISTGVMDMYCLKPIDREAVLKAAESSNLIVTVEEHTAFGGLGASVAMILSQVNPKRLISISLPDAPVITGDSSQVFSYYGLDSEGITTTVLHALSKE